MNQEERRLGFVRDYVDLVVEFDTTKDQIARLLNVPQSQGDLEGYTLDICGGAVHPTKSWVGWVEHREKTLATGWVDVNYFLKARVDAKVVIDWTIETYNPFFGCNVAHLGWHSDELVIVYSEKHCCYVCAVKIDGTVLRMRLGGLGTEVIVRENILAYRPVETRELTVRQCQLPSLNELPVLTQEQAFEMGIVR